jgi:hypothetical protein
VTWTASCASRFGGEQFQHAFAQQIDRANFAIEPLANHLDHGVQFGLHMAAAGHHIVEAGQDRAGSGDGVGNGHAERLTHTSGNGNARERTANEFVFSSTQRGEDTKA